MKKKKVSSKKEIGEETLPYFQAKKLSERWSFYLQNHASLLPSTVLFPCSFGRGLLESPP